MSWELPYDFKYGMGYTEGGSYLGDYKLFKVGKTWFGLQERSGGLFLKGDGYELIRVTSIQDLNDFKSFALNQGGIVDWGLYQDILVSLNSYTKLYSIFTGETMWVSIDVQDFITSKQQML